jgi:hypothetical protein
VCRYSGRLTVDALLVEGKIPVRELATIHSLSASALQRHKTQHVPADLALAVEATKITHADSLFDHVRALQTRSAAILERAETSGDLRAALAALRELRGILELLGRLAMKNGKMVELAVVETYVSKVLDILHEFVPAERLNAAIAKLKEGIEVEARHAASGRGGQ